MRTTPLTITVNAGIDTIVYAANGTKLHFYTYSFKDKNNIILTSGSIYVQIVEMYKPSDMICNRATTVTATGDPLTSGGQVTIKATFASTSRAGEEVFANKYGIGFLQSAPSSQQMELYSGNNNTTDSIVTWTVADTTKTGTVAIGTTTDTTRLIIGSGTTTTVNYRYIFDSCTNFENVNCDHFFGRGAKLITLNVIFPDNTNTNSNTSIYLCFPTDKCVMSIFYNLNATTMQASYQFYAPANSINYELVAFTNNTGKFYYYQTSGSLSATDSVVTINAAMATDTEYDIIHRMSSL